MPQGQPKPVALIVGAGDYIGAAIAKRFAVGGFQVCLGRRNGDKLAPLVEEIEAAGGTAHPFGLPPSTTLPCFAAARRGPGVTAR